MSLYVDIIASYAASEVEFKQQKIIEESEQKNDYF
jgi:hypothetical protein